MSITFSSNRAYSGVAAIPTMMYDFKTFMVGTGGFTVLASGDGVSNFSMSGDVITGGGSGAHGMGNQSSWFILKEKLSYAGVQRQWLFWNYNNTCMNVYNSWQGFSTSGSEGHISSAVSATNAPIAYDEFHLMNPASATTSLWATGSNFGACPAMGAAGTWYANFAVDPSSPNIWYVLICNGGASPAVIVCFGYDALTGYESGNPDPTVHFYHGNTFPLNSATFFTRYMAHSNSSKALATADTTLVSSAAYYCHIGSVTTVVKGYMSGNDFAMPAIVNSFGTSGNGYNLGAIRADNNVRYLGVSSLYIANAPNRVFSNAINYNGVSYVGLGYFSIRGNGIPTT